jgi:hypothetical protein
VQFLKHKCACSHQGRRKLLKVGGGQALRGTFPIKKGIEKFFPGNVGDGGGGVHLKKFCGHTKKIFRIYHIFFLNMKKNFPDITKNFPDI